MEEGNNNDDPSGTDKNLGTIVQQPSRDIIINSGELDMSEGDKDNKDEDEDNNDDVMKVKTKLMRMRMINLVALVVMRRRKERAIMAMPYCRLFCNQ